MFVFRPYLRAKDFFVLTVLNTVMTACGVGHIIFFRRCFFNVNFRQNLSRILRLEKCCNGYHNDSRNQSKPDIHSSRNTDKTECTARELTQEQN